MYGFLADMVMLLHFGFILLALFGGLLALYWPRFVLIHLPALHWALYIEFKPGTLCPLTPLEQALPPMPERPPTRSTAYDPGKQCPLMQTVAQTSCWKAGPLGKMGLKAMQVPGG